MGLMDYYVQYMREAVKCPHVGGGYANCTIAASLAWPPVLIQELLHDSYKD